MPPTHSLTDCGQRDEAEICGIQKRPILPVAENESTCDDVADDEEDAQPYGNRAGPGRKVKVIGIIVVEWQVFVTSLAVRLKSHW